MATGTATRTAEETARANFDAFRARDIDAMAATWREDGVEDIVPTGILRGRDEVMENVRALWAGAPDFEARLERIVADDGHAVIQWRGSGTFTGEPFEGIEATGSHIEMRVAEVMEIEDGLIARNTVFYDGTAFARQIGMMPEQESGAEKAMIAAFNALTRIRKAIDRRKATA
jgi:steroid delta-isomerase-like uncharacterized protein